MDAHPPRKPRTREPERPEATLGELLGDHDGKWVYVYCRHYLCGHRAAIGLACLAIRHGMDAPVSRARAGLRCKVCGRKGARFIRPLREAEFPVEDALQRPVFARDCPRMA